MSKIETGRFSELLRRALGMKGQQTVAAELSPEVSPTWQLEQPTDEWNFLKGVRDCGAGDLVAAGVTFTTKWRLRNPDGSGIIAVVEFFEMDADANSEFRAALNAQIVDFPTPVEAAVIDGRWGIITAARPAVIVTASNAQATAPAGEVIGEARRLGGNQWRYDAEIVLVPGSVLDFGTVSLNVQARMYCRWRERSFPALEADGG